MAKSTNPSSRAARAKRTHDALQAAQMALWNIAGVLSLALDHPALAAQGFPDEVAAAMRVAHDQAAHASACVDPVA